jgi:hypothetical protein
MKVIVTDFDGTLFNCQHRSSYASAGMWDEFHSRLMDDTVNQDVASIIFSVSIVCGYTVEVWGCTGRNEKFRNLTIDKLNKENLPIEKVLMRPDNCYVPDHELKPSMLISELLDCGHQPSDVIMVLDDRDKVVDAWRDNGFNCWQVRPESF